MSRCARALLRDHQTRPMSCRFSESARQDTDRNTNPTDTVHEGLQLVELECTSSRNSLGSISGPEETMGVRAELFYDYISNQ